MFELLGYSGLEDTLSAFRAPTNGNVFESMQPPAELEIHSQKAFHHFATAIPTFTVRYFHRSILKISEDRQNQQSGSLTKATHNDHQPVIQGGATNCVSRSFRIMRIFLGNLAIQECMFNVYNQKLVIFSFFERMHGQFILLSSNSMLNSLQDIHTKILTQIAHSSIQRFIEEF